MNPETANACIYTFYAKRIKKQKRQPVCHISFQTQIKIDLFLCTLLLYYQIQDSYPLHRRRRI